MRGIELSSMQGIVEDAYSVIYRNVNGVSEKGWKNDYIDQMVRGMDYLKFMKIPYSRIFVRYTYYNKNDIGKIYLIPQVAVIAHQILG